MSAEQDVRQTFIRSNLRVTAAPFAPSLRYYAAHPESGLSRLPDMFGDAVGAPYWAHLWPGGAALVRYLLLNPGEVSGRRVLDFGCGAGLSGIAAALAGASQVICADSDPMAQAVCGMNADLNDAKVTTTGALSPDNLPAADLILAGDVFYSPDVANMSETLLAAYLQRGAGVWVGDIGRSHLPHPRLVEIAAFPARDVGDSPSAPPVTARVFTFR